MIPASRATAAAASSDICGVAIITVRAPREPRIAGLRRLVRRARQVPSTAAGSVMPYFARTARASAKVVGSATVGPEAITEGSSPGTSEITSVTTGAGAPRPRAGRP